MCRSREELGNEAARRRGHGRQPPLAVLQGRRRPESMKQFRDLNVHRQETACCIRATLRLNSGLFVAA